jgi:hypothetical protein
METNPYEYNGTIPWIPQQNQLYESDYTTASTGQQRPAVLQNLKPQQRSVDQKPKPPKPMPKARVLALARTFKKWLVIASLVSFGTFSGLVAFHQVGTAATQTSSASSQKTSTTTAQKTTTTASSQNSSSFLSQQGGNNFGSSNSSQGSNSGSSSSSQAPVSGSHTS